MTNLQLAQIISEEINAKTWGVTRQFLEIHDVVYQEDQALIERIDRDRPDGAVVAYLSVKDQKFHLAMIVEDRPAPAITGVYIEPYSSVYFRAFSDSLDLARLAAYTELTPTASWHKGDSRGLSSAIHRYNSLRFEPNPEPDTFEDKLDKLLDFLEQDPDGIRSYFGFDNPLIHSHNFR
jgi:hypothetical protein